MNPDAIKRMFDLLALRTAEAEEKRAAIRDVLSETDPTALAVADSLKKSSTPVLAGSASVTRNMAAGDFGTFAARAAKDE